MRNLHERLAEARDRDAFVVPPFVDQMIARGQLGEKTGKGFYERRKGSERRVGDLDARLADAGVPAEAGRPKIGSIEAGKSIDDLGERVRMLFHSTGQGRRVPPRDAGADAGLHGARHAGHRSQHRRRGSRDAVGLRLGAGALRAVRHHRRARGDGGGHRGGRPCRAGRHAAAAAIGAQRGGEPIPRGAGGAGRARPADPAHGEGPAADGEEERGGKPGRPRRRRARRGVPLEDERDRRRHHRDAAGRREGGREEPSGAGRRQRRRDVLGRREPDAGAARSAGRQLRRARADGAPVPADDDAAALQRRAGGGGPRGAHARRRRRDGAARRSGPGRGRNLHGAGRSRRRADPGGRRHEGDAGARDGAAADAAGGSAAVRAEGVRDRRPRQGIGQRTRCRAARISRRRPTASR